MGLWQLKTAIFFLLKRIGADANQCCHTVIQRLAIGVNSESGEPPADD